jgi:predicted transcriptional regulator
MKAILLMHERHALDGLVRDAAGVEGSAAGLVVTKAAHPARRFRIRAIAVTLHVGSSPAYFARGRLPKGSRADGEAEGGIMKTVTLGVTSREAVSARAAMRGKAQGAHVTFETPELLLQTLTPLRCQLIKVMTGAGPLSIREIGRRVGRDVSAVHRDVHALLAVGVLERTGDGAIEFPFDAVRVDFLLQAA